MESLFITSFWRADPDLLPLSALAFVPRKRRDRRDRCEDNRKKALRLLHHRANKRREPATEESQRKGRKQSCASGGKLHKRQRRSIFRENWWFGAGQPQWISYGAHLVRMRFYPRLRTAAWRISVIGPLAERSSPSTGVKTIYARDRKEADRKILCFLKLRL